MPESLFLVRHAKAGDRSKWDGDDRFRPLTKKGWRQAERVCERIADLVVPESGLRLVSSPYVRCRQTIEPLSARLEVTIEDDTRLAEGFRLDGALELVMSLPHGSVLCSHGDVIPEVITALQRRGAEMLSDPDWRKASVWVLDRHGTDVIAATCWPPPQDDD